MSGVASSRDGLTRRSFLKTTAAVAGAAAIAGGAGLTAIAAESGEGEPSEKIVPGRCYFGGCFSCEYDVTVRDGNAVKVAPSAEALYGRRPCLRGISQPHRLYSAERIQYPMKRVGERGEGKWERVSWDEAIATITEKWKGYIAEYGSQSVAISGASGGARFLPLTRGRFANILQMTTLDLSVDWAFYQGLHRVYGNSATGIMTCPCNEPFEEDVHFAKTIILWGHNLSEAYIQRWRHVMEAQENGAKVIAIDPNETTTAMRADKWYAPRPGSDPALMLSMCQVIIAEGLQDDAYLKSDTVGPFLVRDDDGTFLRGSAIGVEPIEGPANPYTGQPTMIDLPLVWNAAENKPAVSGQPVDVALEGRFEIEGIKVTTAYTLLKEHLQDYAPEKVSEIVDLPVESIVELAHFAADGPVTHMTGMGAQAYDNGLHIGTGMATIVALTGMVGKPGAGIAGAAFPVPMNSSFLFPTFTFATNMSVLSFADVIKTGTYAGQPYAPIKSLLIDTCGLVGGAVNLNSVRDDILANIEFVVCVDTVFSDSAMMADIVLPAAMHFEIEDIYISPVTYDLQYGSKVVEPRFEAKPDEIIIQLLAQGMGIGDFFQGTSEDWLRELLASPQFQAAGVTLEGLREKRHMRFVPKYIAYTDGKYPTGTGKVEFYCENPVPRFEFGQERDIAAERMPRFFPPHEAWYENEIMEKYPFQLISERSRQRWHSQGFDGAWFKEVYPEPTILMNAEDAAEKGIEDGDYIEVYNDRGHAVAKAYLCGGLRKGVLSYPKGWPTRYYKAGNFSELSHSKFDPFAVSSSFFDTCVEVRKWEGGE